MPPPTYNPVWLDEFNNEARSSPRHQRAPSDDTSPRVLVHTQGGATYRSAHAHSLSEQNEVKVPLLHPAGAPEAEMTSAASSLMSSSMTGTAEMYQSTRDRVAPASSVASSSSSSAMAASSSSASAAREQTRPLLTRGSLVSCRYQSTQDSGYDQSHDECNFPPPMETDFPAPDDDDDDEDNFPSPNGSTYEPPPPEVAFETSLDYAYEQDLAQGLYRPSEDDGYAESSASSGVGRPLSAMTSTSGAVGGAVGGNGRDQVSCDHARNQCAYMNTSPFGDFIPTSSSSSAAAAVHMNGAATSAPLTTMTPSEDVLMRYSQQSMSPAHAQSGTPARHQNGSLPPANFELENEPLPPQGHRPQKSQNQPQGQPQGQSTRNTARLTLDGLDLEIQVAPQNCYSGFAPETILRASKAKQRPPRPATCHVSNPEEVGEIILSDVSREVDMPPEPEIRGAARACRTCMLRVAAFLAHVGFFVCVAILGVQIPLKKRYDVEIFILRHDVNAQRELPKPYDEVTLVTASVMLFICYLVALGESYTADTETFVSQAMSGDVLRGYVRELRQQVPIVGWDVVCYHLETRQVTRTTRDRWGNETTSSSEEEVKVMTHRETLRFPFRVVKDISGDINLKGTAITKMEFHQMYGFIDMATAQKFTQIKEKLKERNRYRDEKMEFKEIFAMENLKAQVTVFGEYGCLRQLMRPKIFCFLSCFLFSWPFRLILKLTTKRKKYTVIKVLGL